MFDKKNNQRQRNEVSAGSMADIAFLLLIFFLVATTIHNEKGITTKLNPYHPEFISFADEKENAFLDLYINANSELMLNGEKTILTNLKAKLNSNIEENHSNHKKTIISITHDRATKYSTYLSCYNEIEACYNDIWDSLSNKQYQKDYENLTKNQKRNIFNNYPKLISEKSPTKHGDEYVYK